MLTVIVHPDLAATVPADMNHILWTDLPLLSELPPGPCYLANASSFPATLPATFRVLNPPGGGDDQMGLPAIPASWSGLRTPVVLRSEHLGGCRQSPLLFSEDEIMDELVLWTLRSVRPESIRILEVAVDPFAPFVNGSFLKVGASLIPGRRVRLADWHTQAEPLEDNLPEPAADWAMQTPLDIAQIIYLEQDGQAFLWRVDDSFDALRGYLSERPAARAALQELIDSREWDGGDIPGK